jgi:ribonuclease Z
VTIDSVSDIIITHFHPDHVSSLPLVVMDWWLMGRTAPLTFHGLPHAMERFRAMMALYEWERWPNFFPVEFHSVSDEYQPILQKEGYSIYSAGVKHLIPTLGLAFSFNHKRFVYSCDTEPCECVVQLATGADVLIHEATGKAVGHSTASDCGTIAAKAGVKQLYLIHYSDEADQEQLLKDARTNFGGEVYLATDLMVFE